MSIKQKYFPKSILANPKVLDLNEVIKYAKNNKNNAEEVWGIVARREDVVKHLKETEISQILIEATEINNFEVWAIVLEREDINPSTSLYLAKKISSSLLWEIILKKKCVIEYLKES